MFSNRVWVLLPDFHFWGFRPWLEQLHLSSFQRFISNISWNVFGKVCVQILLFGVSVLLARYLGKEKLGVYATLLVVPTFVRLLNQFGLEFLINDGIIYVPSTESKPPGPDTIIPDWVRTTAGWWAHHQISDDQFISAIQYLIKIGLIEVNATSPERIADEQITQEIQDTTSEQDNIKLHVLTEGYKTVFPSGKYIVDVRVFDADKYSGCLLYTSDAADE